MSLSPLRAALVGLATHRLPCSLCSSAFCSFLVSVPTTTTGPPSLFPSFCVPLRSSRWLPACHHLLCRGAMGRVWWPGSLQSRIRTAAEAECQTCCEAPSICPRGSGAPIDSELRGWIHTPFVPATTTEFCTVLPVIPSHSQDPLVWISFHLYA